MYIEARTDVGSTKHALHFFEDIAVPAPGAVPVGIGKRVPFTDLALDQLLRHHSRRFGSLPTTLPGSLAMKNRLNFQREFVRRLDEGLAQDEAAIAAIKGISFGESRIRLGYDQFTVSLDPERWKIVDLGDPIGERSVPMGIRIDARRSDGK